jgi:hypothetical protein
VAGERQPFGGGRQRLARQGGGQELHWNGHDGSFPAERMGMSVYSIGLEPLFANDGIDS